MELILCIVALIPSFAFADDLVGSLPNPTITPGVIATSSWNDICNTHLSRNRDVSESEKKQVYANYGLTPQSEICTRLAISGKRKGQPAGCEVDHLLDLASGGSNDIKNLWPENYGGEWNARMKDKLENRQHKLICEKQIPDDEVKKIQMKIVTDWVGFYKEQYGNK